MLTVQIELWRAFLQVAENCAPLNLVTGNDILRINWRCLETYLCASRTRRKFCAPPQSILVGYTTVVGIVLSTLPTPITVLSEQRLKHRNSGVYL